MKAGEDAINVMDSVLASYEMAVHTPSKESDWFDEAYFSKHLQEANTCAVDVSAVGVLPTMKKARNVVEYDIPQDTKKKKSVCSSTASYWKKQDNSVNQAAEEGKSNPFIFEMQEDEFVMDYAEVKRRSKIEKMLKKEAEIEMIAKKRQRQRMLKVKWQAATAFLALRKTGEKTYYVDKGYYTSDGPTESELVLQMPNELIVGHNDRLVARRQHNALIKELQTNLFEPHVAIDAKNRRGRAPSIASRQPNTSRSITGRYTKVHAREKVCHSFKSPIL